MIDVFLKTNTVIKDIPSALSGFDCQCVQVRNGGATETWKKSSSGWRKQPRIGCYEDLCPDHIELIAYTVVFGGGYGEAIDDCMSLTLHKDEADAWLRHMERYKYDLEDAIGCSIYANSGRNCALAIFALGKFKTMVNVDAIWGPRIVEWFNLAKIAGADEVGIAISHEKRKPD